MLSGEREWKRSLLLSTLQLLSGQHPTYRPNLNDTVPLKKFRHSFIMTMHDDIKAKIVQMNLRNRHCGVQSPQIIYSGSNLI